ncbi:MAG TPA: hypothetical protein VFU48_03065 [Nitrospira sp.]|nr:hypothetical protein [Nitrospira sp.]
MTFPNRVFASTVVTVVLNTFVLLAQAPGSGKPMRMYDPATEIKITGIVEGVTQTARGAMSGIHLNVRTGSAVKTVLLGPSNFIESKGFSFAKGDSVEISGSKITMNGTEYIIAREVGKNGKVLVLRDKNGRPEWAGTMGRGARR